MLDFGKLKQTENKKELVIDGEKIIVKNPNSEQRKKISNLLRGNVQKDENNDSQINITMPMDDIELYRELFMELVEGIDNLPEDKDDFVDVLNNPSEEFKLIKNEFYDIIREISMDNMREEIRKFDELEAQLLLSKGIKKINNLTNKYGITNNIPSVSINGSEPIKLVEDKPKPKRKYNKKKKTEEVAEETNKVVGDTVE